MDQEKLVKEIIEEVMKSMSNTGDKKETTEATKTSIGNNRKLDVSDYPLGEKMPDDIKTPTGKPLSELTLEKLINGEIGAADVRISPETLKLQAEISDSTDRGAFANNLRRASELIAVPDDRLLEIYDSLRPYRSSKEELYNIANELEEKYDCTINANFIREAADVYEVRGRLRKD